MISLYIHNKINNYHLTDQNKIDISLQEKKLIKGLIVT
jgi:hypothetical protein